MLGIVASKEADIALEQIPCINHLLCFWKNTTDIRALIDLGDEINVITLVYIAKLDVKTCQTDIKV